MTDAAHLHARPEAQALADARRQAQCAATALAAAVALQPCLGEQASVIHAQLLESAQAIAQLQVQQ